MHILTDGHFSFWKFLIPPSVPGKAKTNMSQDSPRIAIYKCVFQQQMLPRVGWDKAFLLGKRKMWGEKEVLLK